MHRQKMEEAQKIFGMKPREIQCARAAHVLHHCARACTAA
jgi:hypothetical protein